MLKVSNEALLAIILRNIMDENRRQTTGSAVQRQ